MSREEQGLVVQVCISQHKGQQKHPVSKAILIRGLGIEGDAHAGTWHRQVSLLADEQVDEMRAKGLELAAGAFGENLVTRGFDLEHLEVGRRFRVGDRVVLQLTQRGKVCHDRCAIYEQAGDCIMPRHGLFARVRRGGVLRPGVPIFLDPELDQLRYAVVTLSDRGAAGKRADASGQRVTELLDQALIGTCVNRTLLPDQQQALVQELVRLCDDEVCDLVVTTGGTGLSPRDITPEATLSVIDRQIPGMAEAMRAAGLAHTPHAMLSRAICGMRGPAIIINLSGSPKAVEEQLGVLIPALPHAISVASGIPQDCARVG